MQTLLSSLECAMETALSTYANIHRGSGHHALATTHLYEHAKGIVLDHLGLDRTRYAVIFCPPRRAQRWMATFPSKSTYCLSSAEFGLPVGLRAVAVPRKELPRGVSLDVGGGTARLVGRTWTVWARGTDRFEPGTPSILHALAFAWAVQQATHMGKELFRKRLAHELSLPAPAHTPFQESLSGHALLAELRTTLLGRTSLVPTQSGVRPYVNLDSAASTPTFRPVWDAVRSSWRASPATHATLIEETKRLVARMVGAPIPDFDVVFTSNTTESINLVAESLAIEGRANHPTHVLTSMLEHNSNELPWRCIPGGQMHHIPFDKEGFLDLAHLEAQLRALRDTATPDAGLRLVAVTGASNVFGTYQNVAAIGRLARAYGARFLVDGAQLIAHREIRMEEWGIDYLAFSGHKIHAPFGTGVLVARKGALAFSDGEWQGIRASGEENIGGIAALGTACDLLRRIGYPALASEEGALLRQALDGFAKIPGVKIYGIQDAASPRAEQRGGLVSFDVKGKTATRVGRLLASVHGIGVRAGCHCAHMAVKGMIGVPRWAESLQRGLVLALPKLSLPGVVRASFGWQTTPAEVEALIAALGEVGGHRRTNAPTRETAAFLSDVTNRVLGEAG